MQKSPAAWLITDPDCGFCQRSAAWLERRLPGDWRNAPADPQLLVAAGLSEAQAQAAVWLVEFDQAGVTARRSGAAAVARLLARRGGLWRGFDWFGRRPLIWLSQPLYELVARNRHRLPGGTPACALPDSPA